MQKPQTSDPECNLSSSLGRLTYGYPSYTSPLSLPTPISFINSIKINKELDDFSEHFQKQKDDQPVEAETA